MNCTISVNTTTIAAEIPKMGGGIAMKATGIVRRIDDLVIIGARSESLENTGVSLILSNFASTQSASCLTAASCNRTYRKEDAAINLIQRKPLSCTATWSIKLEAEP